ncbi:MAG: hypothetical protein JW744_01170 [Candidatus Diapherotrites archaeon]|uniref:Uncharacterized protein n=1 Tax=Candidatus Iainarchaeum sp. TaxID=3101447 RepID=A0A938YMS8_9ARCH|nr:hypothetical protein [Candidatus Diapherotrites archaeon]
MAKKHAEEATTEKAEEEVSEQIEEIEESGEEMPEDKLPFPRATIVNMLRKHLSSGKQIKGQVKDEMNVWLGKMVERIAKKMNQHPYAYVDGGMLRDAIEPYETVQDIEKEKERIIKQLEAVKAACDVLINEVDRKFRQ